MEKTILRFVHAAVDTIVTETIVSAPCKELFGSNHAALQAEADDGRTYFMLYGASEICRVI